MLPIAFMFMRSATQACIWITSFITESFWWFEFGKRIPYFTCKARIRCFVKHLKSSFELKVFLQDSHSRYLGKLKCGYFWSAESKTVSSHLTIDSFEFPGKSEHRLPRHWGQGETGKRRILSRRKNRRKRKPKIGFDVRRWRRTLETFGKTFRIEIIKT